MRELVILLIHLIATVAKLIGRGGARAVVAESLLLKHQLLILNRSRARAPNLRQIDRVIAGLCAGLIRPTRLLRSAIVLKPSTIMALHRALVRARAVDGPAISRMFRHAVAGALTLPRHLSSDHDPLFEFHRWRANLRILDVTEIKTTPHVPLSHPFIERLIGTLRRELLDQIPFWGAGDLERKLLQFREYCNYDRVHASLDGLTPICRTAAANRRVISLKDYRWRSYCRGLYQLPIAA